MITVVKGSAVVITMSTAQFAEIAKTLLTSCPRLIGTPAELVLVAAAEGLVEIDRTTRRRRRRRTRR